MRTRMRTWMFGVTVAALAFVSGAAAQTTSKDVGEAPGIIPSAFGEAVDRDIMTIRAATAKLKTTEAAEAAGYKRVTDCVQYQPAGAMGYHWQNNDLLDGPRQELSVGALDGESFIEEGRGHSVAVPGSQIGDLLSQAGGGRVSQAFQ